MRGGQAIKELLPHGLSQHELHDHFVVQYVTKGIPGKHVASLVVVPEPSTVVLLALGLLAFVGNKTHKWCKPNRTRAKR